MSSAPALSLVHDTVPRDASVTRLTLWLLRYGSRRSAGLLAVMVTMLLKIGLDVLKPWPMKVLVDHALGSQPLPPTLASMVAWLPGAADPRSLVGWSVAATVVLFLASWALGLTSAYANIAFGQRMVYDLAADLFAHLQRLSLRFHARKSVGDSIRRVTTDTGCVSTIIRDALLPLVTSLISLLAMFAIMWGLNPALTLLSLAVVPWLTVVLRRYMQPMFDRGHEQQEAEGKLYDVIEQTLSAIPVVQAFGREPYNDRRLERAASETVRASLTLTRVEVAFSTWVGLATAAGTALIVWAGGREALSGSLTVGGLLVFLSYLRSLYGPLETALYSPSTTQAAAGSARRVLEILETKFDVDERPDAKPLVRAGGHVAFDRVTFGYDAERPVLKNISFEAAPGETIAIVGSTGAGKSTLVSLVARFYDPTAGVVRVDGHDVRDLDLRSLRQQIAIVLQEPFLFPLTIAENIAYGRPHASREAIETAARAANAHEFIVRLPSGYDTLVGERGATLSGGERQRLSIARALLKDAPILILDEPTSALDAETERSLMGAVARLTAGRTTLMIAHRLSTARHADRILVLHHGQVAESGTHATLMARGGIYARFHRLQSGAPGGLARGAQVELEA